MRQLSDRVFIRTCYPGGLGIGFAGETLIPFCTTALQDSTWDQFAAIGLYVLRQLDKRIHADTIF